MNGKLRDLPTGAGSIDRLLRTAAERNPEGDALIHLDRQISYAELYRRTAEAAAGLRRYGVGRGDTVLLAVPNSPEFVVTYFATARQHAAVYAVDPGAAPSELARCLRDAAPKLVLTDRRRAGHMIDLWAEADLATDPVIVVIDDPPAGTLAFADLLVPVAGQVPPVDDYAGDWCVTYSSGSMGSPKRICRTQANQVAEAHNIVTTAGVTPADRFLCVVPLFHALGQFCCMIAAAGAGATLVLLEQSADPAAAGPEPVLPSQLGRILDLIRRYRVTIVPAVPYLYELLADLPAETECDLSSVRLFLSGGNFLPPRIAERFRERHGQPIRQTYGSSEAGSVAWDCAPAPQVDSNSVGWPLRGVEVRVIDRAGQPLAAGVPGEIAVSGPAVMTGYAGRPDLNATAIVDGEYRTGDIGTLTDDGRLYVTGRANLLIDAGGRKVNPLEVEDVLDSHEMVRKSVVTGVSTRGDEMLVALVMTNGSVSASELLDHCRAKLPDYKIPQDIAFRDSLPLSPLGKVRRRDLDLTGLPGHRAPTAALEPQDPTAYLVHQLAGLLQEPEERIDVGLPMLAMGVNSLMAMKLKASIERDLGVPAPMSEMLGNASVATVGHRLEELRESSRAMPMPAGDQTGAPSLTSEQRALWAALRRGRPVRRRRWVAAQVSGTLSLAAIEAAAGQLVGRHPMLQVSFLHDETDGDVVVPTLAEAPESLVTVVDSATDPADHAVLARLLASPPAADPDGPLRVYVLHHRDHPRVVLLTVHALSADLWSMALLVRDFTMLLGAQQDGTELYLPALPYSYRDFASWSSQQQPQTAPPDPPSPERAAATPRFPSAPAAPGPLTVIDAATTRALRAVAGRFEVSLAEVALAALLRLQSSAPALAGTLPAVTAWGRSRPEFRDVVGVFSQVVPSASAPAVTGGSPDVVFTDCIALPPELATFVRFAAGSLGERFAVAGGHWTSMPMPAGQLPYLLEMRLLRAGDEIQLDWDHDATRLSGTELASLADQLAGLLRAAAADPDLPLPLAPSGLDQRA